MTVRYRDILAASTHRMPEHDNFSPAFAQDPTLEVPVIRGVHTMFYSSRANDLRAFLRDKLGLRATDVGDGWLIFDVPEADMGCHPVDDGSAASGTHDISFDCDDIETTVAEL